MDLNLLDLPPHVLEKIFLYCLGCKSFNATWKITKITETCKFLKEFFENSSRLMDHLYLIIRKRSEVSMENREILQALLASNRKFHHTSVPIDKKTLCEVNVIYKKIFDQSGANVKTVKIHGCVKNQEDYVKVISFLENLKVVESIEIRLDNSTMANPSELQLQFPDNNFENLRCLVLNFNSPLALSMLNLFKTSRKIETLNLTNYFLAPNFSDIYTLIANSCTSLRNICFNFARRNDISHFEFRTLKDIKLNLKSLDFYCNWIIDDYFMEFLSTQENLESLQIYCCVETNFFTKISDVFNKPGKLKNLSITISNEFSNQMPCKIWNIPSLEELDLNYEAGGTLANGIQASIFQLPNNNLRELRIFNLGLEPNIFEQITRNYKNLRMLTMYDDWLMCADIAWIFKNLKELEILDISLWIHDEVGPVLFDTDAENLILTKIQFVSFVFNSPTNYVGFLQSIIKFIGQVSRLDIDIDYNSDEDALQLETDKLLSLYDCLTKQLPNLKDLSIFHSPMRLEKSNYLQIQSNLNEFNKNPEQFKFNSKSLQDWIKE